MPTLVAGARRRAVSRPAGIRWLKSARPARPRDRRRPLSARPGLQRSTTEPPPAPHGASGVAAPGEAAPAEVLGLLEDERHMLVRAQAAVLLEQRGYDISELQDVRGRLNCGRGTG
ncbi:MAG: hypothetical protein M5U01_24765 [Ardenticatenaceae bacterium]|nr:hypothetical protein [Ardenticatenaceae bacterium]